MMLKKIGLILLSAFVASIAQAKSDIGVLNSDGQGFPLSVPGINTVVYCDSSEQEVIRLAADLLCSDLELVTGRKPQVVHTLEGLSENVVIIGSADGSSLIRKLVDANRLTLGDVPGSWERYKIQTLDSPLAGVSKALVVVGSDRRGTAYGVFDLSKAIGVSPWYWWADITPKKKEAIWIDPIDLVSKEPTVKYRGIFINDEDWGLQEWSQVTFDPVKDMGPKTYEKVCELLLRLKANYLWPAMHPCTKPFNYYPDNKVVADKYAILMGSSHHEPLLYNTYEWPYPTSEWNAFTNMDKIMGELEKRVASNGSFENIYTVGLRGTEDGSAAGGATLNEKTEKLEEVIRRQRELLSTHVNPNLQKVPQVFWPYKEVTDVYNNHMDVPDDITLGWVDDNYGYVRQVSNPMEQARTGGSGVYYHLSYWGIPNDYLWIASTPPALIASELKKTADFGGNRVWVFNVGDIKPAEMLTSYCLDLAWDYHKWGTDNVREYLLEWFEDSFGKEYAEDITNAYEVYFQLAQAAKPEHINQVKLSEKEKEERLLAYQALSIKIESIYARIPVDLKDAFFETVYYPIVCAGLMNEKFIYASKSYRAAMAKDPNALMYSQKALQAYTTIKTHTNYYNTGIKNGKWNKIIASDIRDQSVYDMPAVAKQTDVNKVYSDVISVNMNQGSFVAPMKNVDGIVYGDKAGKQTVTSGGKATFTFESATARTAEIYFYAKTPSLDEDSWYININGTSLVQNDATTGNDFDWIKVWTGAIKAGTNTLVINQREPNAQIAAIQVADPGVFQFAANYIPEADTIIPAWQFSKMQNASGYEWSVIDGLTTSQKGVANTPLTLPSIDLVKDAPYLEQEVDLSDSSFMLEVRCLPTRKLYEGRDLRIGIAINDAEPRIFSIHEPYPTIAWEKNVLRGYVKRMLNVKSDSSRIRIRLYALDPGVVFDKILIYKDYAKAVTPTAIHSVEKNTKDLHVVVCPNPCNDFLTVLLEKKEGEAFHLELTDLMGKTVLRQQFLDSKKSETITLPVSKLAAGTYVLVVGSKTDQVTQLVEKF